MNHSKASDLDSSGATDLSDLDDFSIPEIPNRPPGRRTEANGVPIYHEIYGEGDPLLLIHGGGATLESWFAQIPALAARFQVIAVDSRGHGRTPHGGGELDFGLMAADFAALLDSLGVSKVGIVGWSDGGVIALQLAMQRPDLVGRIVAFGAHARPAGMTEEFAANVEASTAENFPAILADAYKALSPDGAEHWPVIFGKLQSMWLTQPDFSDDELRRISCPVLLVTGEHDIVRPEETRRIQAIIPNARHEIISGASHYCPIEAPDRVNEIIIGFLSGT